MGIRVEGDRQRGRFGHRHVHHTSATAQVATSRQPRDLSAYADRKTTRVPALCGLVPEDSASFRQDLQHEYDRNYREKRQLYERACYIYLDE